MISLYLQGSVTARVTIRAFRMVHRQQLLVPTSFESRGNNLHFLSHDSRLASPLPMRWGGAAATIQHKPTGLFVFGGWGKQHIDTDNAATLSILVEPIARTWFIQPGIEQKWLPLGKTNIFGEYRHDDAGSNPGKTVSSNVDFWQAGVVQYIDAAEMSLYVVYEHADGAIEGNVASSKLSRRTVGPL